MRPCGLAWVSFVARRDVFSQVYRGFTLDLALAPAQIRSPFMTLTEKILARGVATGELYP
jgi:hypothetical protein